MIWPGALLDAYRKPSVSGSCMPVAPVGGLLGQH